MLGVYHLLLDSEGFYFGVRMGLHGSTDGHVLTYVRIVSTYKAPIATRDILE